ncbi:alkylation response protein AidB-like acyl-CoA dehydrogenase [Nocardioides daedukensis]|uniref:Alkylation response protein AidB-like acyl-CoA dehydrogenase n=1 Tax=Nocardioides daedukensis TaxID=634462 RepID=A0A7Y9S1M2_9ACTN|nr:acyl-CoA dehydrogenase family protein [Nocardioides daedukensis]NYG59551.1 alkylation response protein AidB-like acyl-CoA dehydrogenase [Nocardioides daedukensis]
MSATTTAETVEEFADRVAAWFATQGLARKGTRPTGGKHSKAVFHDLSFADEQALLSELTDWVRTRYDSGFGAIAWPESFGGAGLTQAHETALARIESDYEVPSPHELVSVTRHLIAPTLRAYDRTQEMRELITPMLRGDLLACQLFSEPGAGSDLASLATRARREGDDWVITGQKVWTSGAQFAQWGELLARTNPDVPKHRGITAFMVPLDADGLEVRPLRQMSGGSSFNEVFLTEVRIPDAYRIGEVDEGWKVALTTLGFERNSSGENTDVGGTLDQVIELARTTGAIDDPVLRQRLADVVMSHRLAEVASARDAATPDTTGVGGSMRKLQWTERLTQISDFVADVAGADLVVDDGSGIFAWTEHVLGAPGYRIAGGSDEVQRTLIAERYLGLPVEPRGDKTTPWRDIPR